MKRDKLPWPWFRGYWTGICHAVMFGLFIGGIVYGPLRHQLFDRAFGDLIGTGVIVGIGFIGLLPDMVLGLAKDVRRFRAAAAPHPIEGNSSSNL